MTERPFSIDELFVSTTDRKGHIRMTNHVFVRVSGYERDELIGKAHNVIRHPDMPRSVFRLFWQFLEAGRPVAAYVKNLAKDGAYYWVMAIAIPVPDGYLSVRLKPTSPLFDVAREIYADVREVELGAEGGDPRERKASIEAGTARVAERLSAAGFEDYESFMRAAFAAEVAAREQALTGVSRSRDLTDAEAGLRGVVDASVETVEMLHGLGRRLTGHGELSESLKKRSGFVRELSESIRLFSLNAILSASRLGDGGAALGAVAGLLRTRSDAAAPEIVTLGTELEQAVELLAETTFRAAAAKIQAEMMTAFADELLDDSMSTAEAAPQLRLLAEAIAEASESVCSSIAAVDANLDRLSRVSRAVEQHLDVIRALEVNGRIEAARVPDTEQVRVLFEEISKQVEAAGGELHVFSALGDREDRDDGSAARESRELTTRVRTAVAALA
ncbi:PAS domain-containing protein [Solirubrobacter soli]|uniref:PAS domain-containing protein n=1 Tax=Solirubrobacter soli TaxID=363832 RepID=UPI0003F952B9|nr:PAS domain-containing protein [Solirubrobacter soli]